jgi:hypothetical protein
MKILSGDIFRTEQYRTDETMLLPPAMCPEEWASNLSSFAPSRVNLVQSLTNYIRTLASICIHPSL